MCDCINTVQGKMQAKFVEHTAGIKNAVITEEARFQHRAISLSGNQGMFLYLPLIGKYTQGKAKKNWEVNLYFSYCPFCGEKLPKDG